MFLDDTTFRAIVEATPLVAIDLVIRNTEGAVLLGKRVNRPARGYWFVPGGRIRKNECVQDTMQRVADSEPGLFVDPDNLHLIGVYEHHYADNVFDDEGVGTHYVVLAYEYLLRVSKPLRKDGQHSELKWWKVEDLLASPNVHKNTKAYFTCRTPVSK